MIGTAVFPLRLMLEPYHELMIPTNPEEHEQKLAGLRLLIREGLESGLPVEMTREELRALIGRRMAELHGEVARGDADPAG